MKRLLITTLGALLHLIASAQTLAQAQAGFRQELAQWGKSSPPGAAVLRLVDSQPGWAWWPQFQASPARVDGGGGFEMTSVPMFLPAWAVAPLAEWVASQGWPAGKSPGVAPARWPSTGEVTSPAPEPTAFIVAGPAVKDGVAQYRRDGGDTVVRLGIDDGQASLWLWAAKTLGWGVQLRLRETPPPEQFAEVQVSAVFSTPAGAPRVWAVSPTGMTEARLQRLQWGGLGASCESWVELRWAGAAEPPVWGVLALANPAWAAGATIQRQPVKPGDAASPRGDLRLALPAAPALGPLRLRATLFEFVSADLEAEPDSNGQQPQRKRGAAWGTRIWTEAAISQPYEDWNPPPTLSAAGSPRCPVR